jgi:hypothetical protein
MAPLSNVGIDAPLISGDNFYGQTISLWLSNNNGLNQNFDSCQCLYRRKVLKHPIYFGPKAPKGKDSNWIETVLGKVGTSFLNLYGVPDPCFDWT